jgi:hypothetical protein
MAMQLLVWWQTREANACDEAPGHVLHPHESRGSLEIDLFEVKFGLIMPDMEHMPAFKRSSL